MKLYTYEAAPNGQRLALFMKHKGIQIETQQIDLGTGEQLGEAYRAINPLCTIPTLVVDEDNRLTEVIAQCMYLESIYPERPLMGTTDLERAQVLEWDHRLFMTGTMAVADILRNGSKAFENRALPGPVDIPQIPALIERGKLRLEGFWSMVEQHLNGRDYMVGNGLSFADIDLFCLCGFVGWIKQGIPEDCQATRDWHARVSADLA